jgi:hypothetical protein
MLSSHRSSVGWHNAVVEVDALSIASQLAFANGEDAD